MAKPPGIPVRDWNPRTQRLHQGKTTVDCADCGKEKIADDIVVDDDDSANLCPSCAVERVEGQVPPGQYKKSLLGKALGKIKNGRT